jgi:hypothetical protein
LSSLKQIILRHKNMDMRAGGLSFGNNKPTINEKICSDLEHGERRKTTYRELKKGRYGF